MERFEKFKEEILARAKAALVWSSIREHCTPRLWTHCWRSARDNFRWAVYNDVIDGEFIDKWEEEFAAGRIWHNCNVKNGFLLATEGRFVARGNSSVVARGNSSVVARDNSYTNSYDVIECQLNENAIHRIRKTNTIRYANKDMKFELVEG